MPPQTDAEIAETYFVDLAAAFVRGSLPVPPAPDVDVVRMGLEKGLRIHKFKRNSALPRVQRVLGILKGLLPPDGPTGAHLLDVGSGRGTFLWPLLHALPWLTVTSLERDPRRHRDLDAVHLGGVARLTAVLGDVARPPLPDGLADVVTVLEVLEHVEHRDLPDAARSCVRLARRFVVASVPSHGDDNPEHLRLFTAATLTDLLVRAGAVRVQLEGVHNHLLAVARVPAPRGGPGAAPGGMEREG